ncbi:MAG: hypothetical protein AAF322_10030, partial [Pseudomonadota bacterium]
MGFGKNWTYIALVALGIYVGIIAGAGGPMMDTVDDILGAMKGEDANFIGAEGIADVAGDGAVWCFDRSATGECAWVETFENAVGEPPLILLHTPLYPRSAPGRDMSLFGRLAYRAEIRGDRLCPGERGLLAVYDSPDVSVLVEPGTDGFRRATPQEAKDFEFAFVKPRHGSEVCWRVSRATFPLLGTQYRIHAYNGETRQGSPIRFFVEPREATIRLME